MNAKKDWHQKDNGMIWKDKMANYHFKCKA